MLASALAYLPLRSISGRSCLRRLPFLFAMLLVSCALVLLGMNDAEAATRKKRKAAAFVPTAAALVMDAHTGRILYSSNADAHCYPASLTKVMTLYLLFERLQQGKIGLDTRIPVSAHAANQAPSRLGLRPGETVRVEDAILALVTKSANDVAAAVAEHLGGTEKGFARMMTAKARVLGMSRTQYMNASGLPNKAQLTTARDQATLARRIQTDFPQYYAYFSTEEFDWRGQPIRNHNRLLGKYAGVNGLKTGYTAASGFNLTTTVRHDGKSIIGVVLGGKTARARDTRMVSLLDQTLPRAVALRDTGSRLAAAMPAGAPGRISPAGISPAGISNEDRTALAALAAADDSDPDEASYTGTDRVASLRAAPLAAPAAIVFTPAAPLAAPTEPLRTAMIEPDAPPSVLPVPRPAGPAEKIAANRPAAAPFDSATAYALAALRKAQGPVRLAGRQIGNFIVTPAQASEGPQPTAPVTRLGTPPQRLDLLTVGTTPRAAASSRGWTAGDPLIPEGSWVIQIGAYAEQADAVDRIRSAIKAAPELSDAVPVTIPVKTADNRTLYRSRFGGFEGEKEARSACGRLARESISCIAIPPANWVMPRDAVAREKARG